MEKTTKQRIWIPVVAFSCLVAAALSPFAAEAGRHKFSGPSEEMIVCHLQTRLNLTPEQKQSVITDYEQTKDKWQIAKWSKHNPPAPDKQE